MDVGQIAQTSGVSVSTLTRLFKVTRMTTVAAEAILAIPAPTPTAPDESGAGPRPDSTRQLRAPAADGWSLTQLADAAGIDEQTAWRTVHGYTTASRRTFAAVDALYQRLRLEVPGDACAAVRSAGAPNATAGPQPPESHPRAARPRARSTRSPSIGWWPASQSHCGRWNSRQRYAGSPASSPTTR